MHSQPSPHAPFTRIQAAASRARVNDVPANSAIILPSIASLRLEVKRRQYLTDVSLWAKERLGVDLWSKQREIAASVVANRYTAVKSCYESGKSFTAAILTLWWIDVHPPGTARVVTTAPTRDQVRSILWHEIGRAHARGQLAGRCNQTELWLTITNEDGSEREEMVAFGRKPSEHNPTAIQGIHELYPLFIGDEAAGIPKSLLTAAAGIMGNDNARMLLIGNPEDGASEFARLCSPSSNYHVIKISAFDTPNFTHENVTPEVAANLVSQLWVSERETDWGIESPMYISKVLGEFPENSVDSLLSLADIRAAQERWSEDEWDNPTDDCEIALGVDVGGGANKNVICRRQGMLARVIHDTPEADTMKTLSAVLAELETCNASAARIDAIGIGHGASDRASEMATDQSLLNTNRELARRAAKITGVEVGRVADDSAHYVNLRAEGYWRLRELFKLSLIALDPRDHLLAAQLSGIRWKYSAGRIQIESKKDMLKRKMPSPDRADALMLAFMPNKEVEISPVWGRGSRGRK